MTAVADLPELLTPPADARAIPPAKPIDRALPLSKRHLPALDGIRGIAVLAVILFHWLAIIGSTNPILDLPFTASHAGWMGVELFFALSGFLITGILYDSKSPPSQLHTRNSILGTPRVPAPQFFLTFYGRRALRIFPLYYGTIAAFLLAGLVLPSLATSGYHQLVHDQPWLWLYGVNVGIGVHGPGRFEYDWFDFTHFWTLAIEEHFYLLWPLVIYLLPRRRAMAAAATLFVGSLALRYYAPPVGSGWARGLLATPMYTSGLAAGALVALHLRGTTSEQKSRRLFAALSLLGLAGLVTACVLSRSLTKETPLIFTLGISFMGLCFAPGIGYVALGPIPAIQRTLQSRPLVTLGKYSYGLYVFHNILGPLYRSWDWQHWFSRYLYGALTYLAIVTLVATALTFMSWHLYEKHFLKLKKYLPY